MNVEKIVLKENNLDQNVVPNTKKVKIYNYQENKLLCDRY